MNILKTLTLTSLTAAMLVAAPQDKKQEQLEYVQKQGQKGSQLLLKTLGKNMKKSMKKGGVMNALSFCSNEAYTLTQEVNKKLPKGVRVKRISNNYRSPANVPEGNEAAILKSLEELQKLNVVLPEKIVEQIDANTFKYYKPLVINKKVCLQCHGNITDIDLKRAIDARYPLDKAMGYKMNDLRGAVVVTIIKSTK